MLDAGADQKMSETYPLLCSCGVGSLEHLINAGADVNYVEK